MAFSDYSSGGGGGGLDGTPGFMLKMPGTPHSTQLPDWRTFTEIRVFPSPAENGDWHPMRTSIEYDQFGPGIEAKPACRKLGVYEQFTYITEIPGHDGEDPTTKLTRALISTAEESPHDLPREWAEWCKGGPGRAAKVGKVQTCVFFQGAALSIKGKPCQNRITKTAEPRFPILFMGSISLLMTFSRKGNTRVEGSDMPAKLPAVDTPEGRQEFDRICGAAFELGDWCSAEHGRIMKIFQAEVGENERPHYEIEMLDEKPLNEAMQNRVRDLWLPWDQLLRHHTAEQQIGYLKRAFPKEVLDFALGRSEYEGLLPEGVAGSWQKLQARLSGAWSPGMPDAAQHQVQQYQQSQQPPAQQAPADDGWGSGSTEKTASPGGPAMPDTPSEFEQTTPTTTQPAAAPATQSAPATPADAVRSGAIDPAKLAETLDMLNSTPGEAGNAGEVNHG